MGTPLDELSDAEEAETRKPTRAAVSRFERVAASVKFDPDTGAIVSGAFKPTGAEQASIESAKSQVAALEREGRYDDAYICEHRAMAALCKRRGDHRGTRVCRTQARAVSATMRRPQRPLRRDCGRGWSIARVRRGGGRPRARACSRSPGGGSSADEPEPGEHARRPKCDLAIPVGAR